MNLKIAFSQMVLVSTTIVVAQAAFAQIDGPDKNLFGDKPTRNVAAASRVAPKVSGSEEPVLNVEPMIVGGPKNVVVSGFTRLKDLVAGGSNQPLVSDTGTAKTVKRKAEPVNPSAPPTEETPTAGTVKRKAEPVDPSAPPTEETPTAGAVKHHNDGTAATVKRHGGADVTALTESPTAGTVKSGSQAGMSNVRCAKQQEPGSVGGLRATGANLGRHLDAEIDDDPNMVDLLPAWVKTRKYKNIDTPNFGEVKSARLKKLWAALKTETTKSKCARKGGCGSRSRTKDRSKPTAMCAQGVRMAFEKAFGKAFGSYKLGWAKYAGPNFKKYGWEKLSPIGDLKSLPVGAVLIYKNTVKANHPGHIEVKMPDGFYSDFYERGMINEKRPRGLGLPRKVIEVWVPPSGQSLEG